MPIYIDPLFATMKGLSCHLWADDEAELHRFAQAIGLKREWCHVSYSVMLKREWPHYDLTPNKRQAAIMAGAQEISLREWLKRATPEVDYDSGAGG